MTINLIRIGNSKGIRIPKSALIESGIEDEMELKVKRGEIKLIPAKRKARRVSDTALLSESAFARDWNRPEEDEAWKDLQ